MLMIFYEPLKTVMVLSLRDRLCELAFVVHNRPYGKQLVCNPISHKLLVVAGTMLSGAVQC